VPVADPDALAATERWFTARGIPHFIDGYSASEDIFTRVAPLLLLVFIAELFGALNLTWPVWANVLAVLGGLAMMLGAWVLVNAARGRPALARPTSIEWPELAAFVIAPALLPLVFGGQLRSAAVTLAGNLALLAAAYVITSYGILPMARWAAGRVLRQLGALLDLMGRALPLLLVFAAVLFLTTEVWQTAGTIEGPFYWITLALFLGLGGVFVLLRLPRELTSLGEFGSWAEVQRLVAGTPVERLAVAVAEPAAGPPPLSRRQWGNVGLVILFSQALQILLVSVAVGGFFVVFGLLVIPEETVRAWLGAEPHVLVSLELWGRTVELTEQLLRVAGFIAAFSGLYFAVYAITDATFRHEFFEDVVGEVREAFAVRAVYLATAGGEPA